MSRMIKWLVTLVAGAGVFALGWWICDGPLAMDTGTALGIAAVPSSLVLTPLGWWAGRETSGDVGAIGPHVGRIDHVEQMVVHLPPATQGMRIERAVGQVAVGPVPREPQHFQLPTGAVDALTGLAGGSVAVVCAVTGLRGVGKTQAAGAYARQRIADGWTVAWIPAQAEDLVVAGLAELADALELRRPDDTAEVVAARVRNYLQTLRDPALLVFDNVTDPAHVIPHLPAAGNAQIVLTSASHAIDQMGTRVPVELFSPDTAARFLTDSTGLRDDSGARELARELGYLPLALAQAAARVVRIDRDYATYLRRHQSVSVDRLLVAGAGDPYPHGAAEAILLAVEPFTDGETGEQAADVLDLLSVLSPDGITRDVLTATPNGADDDSPLDDVLAALFEASLIEFAGADDAVVVMHRLTQRVLRDRADHDLPTALTRAARLLRDTEFPEQRARQRELGDELIRHLSTLWSLASATTFPTSTLNEFLGLRADTFYNLSYWYWRLDRPVAERILLRQALPLYRRLSDVTEHGRQSLADCLHYLGASYLRSRVTDRAASRLWQAYELFAELAAEDAKHEERLADTCADLGPALQRTGRFHDSIHIAEHEVRLRRQLSVADPAGQQRPLCLGLLRLAYGQAMVGNDATSWRTALQAQEVCRALTVRPGEPSAASAWLLHRLAETLSLCGRHDWHRAVRAMEPARRAVRIYRRLVDQDIHRYKADLTTAVTTYTTVLERLGRHAEALDVQRRNGA